MKLTRLDIQSLPGIEPGFAVTDIAPGINLVTGPNAVGKSSLIRALRYLIGGVSSADPTALSLAAAFSNEENRLVRRAGSQVAWTVDGRPADPPPLAGRDQLHCYWLSMEDLLEAGEADQALVAELRTALAGGYDLRALRGAGGLDVGPRIGHSEARAVHAAERHLRQVEADYEALRRDEAKLPQLEERIDAARGARDRLAQLDNALSLLEARSRRRELEAALATFPEPMPYLRGDEMERLRTIEEQRTTLRRELDAARTRQADAGAELQETGLAEQRPTEDELETERGRLEGARHARERLADRRAQLERARAEEAQALGALDGGGERPKLSPEAVSEAEGLARRLQGKQAEVAAVEARLHEAPEAPREQTILQHAAAAEALRAWLAAGQRDSRPILAAAALAALGALVAAGAGAWPLVSLVLTGGWPAMAAPGSTGWIALAGGAAGLAGAVWAALAARDTGLEQARRRFAATGLEPPAEWQQQAVAERLETIETRRAELHRAQVRVQEAENQRQDLERASNELETLDRQREEMASRMGFDPSLTAVGLDHFVRRVSEYQQAAVRRAEHEAEVARLEGEIDQALARVRHFLDHWVVRADDSLEGLAAALGGLADRRRRAEDAERQYRDSIREAQRLDEALHALAADEARLFRAVGLEPGEHRTLEACCERLEEWRAQRRSLEAAEVRESQQREALTEQDELLALVEREERDTLERERSRAAEEAERLEELQRERTEIRTRLADAGADQKLERALAERDAALDGLQDRCDETLFAEAGRFLLDDVEREHRSEHEPAVLRDARERFQRFTHHAWDLALDDERGFMARDTQQGRQRTLAELSSGTRMQLLLAVRLAWTRRLEHGRAPLPLFLDEALTTADETRFSSVARSLEMLAGDEGRQVFYLSARRHELALWEHLTGHRPHHIDLAAVRFGSETAATELALPEPETLPEPGDMDAPAYAETLGVPPVDPRRSPEGLHLFHLLRDDLPLLHHLMEHWRVATLGQLETLLESTAAHAAVADARERLAGRCAAARAWTAAWRRGRGRPVDRMALEASDAVSETFMDRVAAVADELAGDGEALLAALREGQVKGFRSNKAEELAQWLADNGYIDPAEPLSTEDRERQTLMEAADSTPPEEARQVVRWLEAGLAG